MRQAKEGIYIDFEGFAEAPPALVGVLTLDRFEQIVLDPALEKAAKAKNLKTSDLSTVVLQLLNECDKRNRKIFAFTRHELNVVTEFTEYGERFHGRYKDGHKIAKRWFNRLHHGEQIPDWSLRSIMEFVGRPRPAWMGQQQASGRIRAVIEMLARRGSYGRLTPVVKAKWTKLLNYNRADCEDLRFLVIKAVEELSQNG